MKSIFSLLLLPALLMACGNNEPHPNNVSESAIDWEAAADSSSQSLIDNYWNADKHHFNNDNQGNIGRYDYWPEAHGLDVLVDAYSRTGDNRYKTAIYDFHEGVKAKNGDRFWNNYYDDMAWHGLAHLRALEATGDTRYEESAKALWEWILEGWDSNDGGGIRWNHDNTDAGKSKGVPSNGPAAIIAARRWQKYGKAEMVQGKTDSAWLVLIYDWMKGHRFEPQTGRVFESKTDTNGDWTYNAGTFIGAAIEFYNITGEKTYLNDAIKTSDWATSTLINTDNRVLSDWAEQQDHDVNLFKGIFVRYFTQLIVHEQLPEVNRKRYLSFMENSAEYLWSEGVHKSPSVLFGYHWWEKPSGTVALRTQLSGSMMMEAMALLQLKMENGKLKIEN
jgi:predicted alpha-1,6-mannanase (GH76 family)